MSADGVQVLKVFGREYSFRAPPSQEALLQDAAALLQQHLAESQRQFPNATGDKLLVLTALNLCVPLLKQDEQLQSVEQRIAASLARINRQLDATRD
ncbi:cell division protein ZapA [Pseudomonas sp. S5(2021)]|jgi:cell division protein ZapA (FtsZ GTPase activity inhibitor)|uniref:cell division protein ZapA n=1 Tax=Stutzerimonas TaxID=2901164 RepID=UPI00077441FD|nr:cell division protein ZapA [Stutzerimonas balearica]MBB61103.1 cell division protein ZapA [Pseudomonas sp.]MBZ5756778.1 cell division protein ZapA [Pseudomonas sp. S5(2021)]MBC7200485.1 cell division protein ZapA [Stutzerimonas balearica]MCZ4127586.1 cell division protein ZapA [Stutzerimonas balearica]OMG61848.1 cell division protein ZapA [Stutzerimonas balearica]